MALDFSIKQSYNLDSLIIIDNSSYSNRNNISGVSIAYWDYNYGSVPSDPSVIKTFSKTTSQSDWVDFWDSLLDVCVINMSNFGPSKLDDGAYYFQISVTGESLTPFLGIFGLHQEVENKISEIVLGYNWESLYEPNSSTSLELSKILNWYDALKLSIEPGSLIGNFNTILFKIQKYLRL